jgi:integrase
MAGRRGNNEGSIYKRGDGRWVSQVWLGYENGKPKRKYLYGRTREEVAGKLAKATRARDLQLPQESGRQTVAQFLDHWLESSARHTLRPSTYTSYESIIRIHLRPALGRTQLSQLSPQEVQALLSKQLADGLSPRTVQYTRAILRRALGHAVKWGLVARNVAQLVDAPKVERPASQPFTPDEARAFLAAIKGERLEAMYLTAITLGLRQGELLGLTWEDVDLDEARLHVRKALQWIDGEPQRVEPKTRKSRRALPIPSFLVAALRAHRKRQLEARLQAGDSWGDPDLIFTTALGKPLHPSNVTHGFQRLLERHGLRRQRFHDLRHACASLLLAKGVELKVVQDILGHSQISLTADTYAHVMPAMKKDALDGLEELLG